MISIYYKFMCCIGEAKLAWIDAYWHPYQPLKSRSPNST